MWLSWDWAAVLACCLGVAGLAGRRHAGGRWAGASAFAIEASLVAALYAVWQFIGNLTTRAVTGAAAHGLWLWRLERTLHLPSELSMNHAILRSSWLVQLSNGFYAVVHVPALGIFLFWMYFVHRERYPHYRDTLAVLTFTCLVIHLIPVAPPRLVPGVGFVDTGLLYHQSVYGAVGTGISDQVSAMPSLHIAWAALIAVAVIQVSRSRWRWLIVLHPVVTMLVVVVTANHFWLDGVAAAWLLGLSSLLVSGLRTAIRAKAGPAPEPPPEPLPTLEHV